MILAVVLEMLGASVGLGWSVYKSTQMMSFVEAWVAVSASVIVSLAVYGLVSFIGGGGASGGRREEERMANERPTIGIIGGTGHLGSGLARRWSVAGYTVVLGSRSKDKAEAAAGELGASVRRADNVGAGDIVVIAVPYSNHASILTDIKAEVAGKIVVDAVVPLMPPKVAAAQLPAGGWAAQIAQALREARPAWCRRFTSESASKVHADGSPDCDVLVFGAGLSRPRGNRPPSRRIAEQAINCRR